MEKFVVSARKYRPNTFDSVVGQKSITDTLKNAIRTGHLAQAFLFCGSRGVGKTTCARILAKTINCSNRTDNVEACNECDSCKSFNEGNSLNILEMDAASNNSVDNIRELTDQVRFAPQVGDYKVYIIDEVHMLSQAAFNAFLKTLEEPPAHAIFILATTEKHKIIPTILSRCQIFDFNRIRVEDISNHLASIAQKENIQAEDEALHIIAQKADGALRDALSIFDQLVSFSGDHLTYDDVIKNLNILDYDYYFKCTDILLAGNIPAALLLFDEIRKRGFDGHLFINGLASHLRNLLVCQDTSTLELLEAAPSVKERYKEQATKVESDFLMKALDICRECDSQYKGSKNQRLLVELSLMKMASLSTSPPPQKKKFEIRSHEAEQSSLHGNNQINRKSNNQSAEPQKLNSEVSHSEGPALQDSGSQGVEASEESRNENAESGEEKAENSDIESISELVEKESSDSKSVPENEDEKVEETVEEKKRTPIADQQTPSSTRVKKEIQTDFKPNRTRSLSIHELTSKQEAEEANKEKEAYTSDDRNEFSEEEFQKVWDELAEKVKEEAREGSSMVYTSMTSRKPKIQENFKIEVVVDNKSQAEEMLHFRTDLHDHLRKKLSNGAIEIHTKVNKDKKQRRAYTDEEKFKEMAEKNPDLLLLKKQLDLDFF